MMFARLVFVSGLTGMFAAVPHTIGHDKNAIVRNAPQYTVPIDYEERGKPIVYNRIDRDFAVSVVTPRHAQTARARLHFTDPGSYSHRFLRGRHHAPKTSKSFIHSNPSLKSAENIHGTTENIHGTTDYTSRHAPPLKTGHVPATPRTAARQNRRGGVIVDATQKSVMVHVLRMPPKTART